MNLREWAEAYIRHRDVFERKLAKIETIGGDEDAVLSITNKDSSRWTCIVGSLESALPKIPEGRSLIVTRNRKPAVAFLAAHWGEFSKHAQLKIVFASVKLNEKWVLCPATHEKVADPESLALGLAALFEAVPEDA